MSKPVEPMGQFKMLSAEALSRGIELLRHGGSEGIALFMTTAQEMLAVGGEDALQSWLTIATPALPERANCRFDGAVQFDLQRGRNDATFARGDASLGGY